MQINEIVAPYLSAADFQGVIGLQRDGEEPLILPYGFASVELGVPHRSGNIFMIGSISKQFTAVAILLLEETGKLKTTDLLSKFIPDFPRGNEITIEQLLTHTSGIADVYSLKSFGTTSGLAGTFEAVVAELATMSLTFEPGEGYSYSNGGYSLLGAVIEKASGMPFRTYLETNMFERVGMRQTTHDFPGEAVRQRVPGYDPIGASGLMPVKRVAPAYTLGNGSLWSSAEDLLKWSAALHTGKLISKDSYKKLTQDYGQSYGFGVSLFKRFNTPVIGHDGRVAGYASDLARYIDKKLSVVVLSNVQSVSRDEIRSMVAAAALGEAYEIPELQEFAELDVAKLEPFLGSYSFGPFFIVRIVERNGRLLAQANEGGFSELTPTASGAWFSRMLYTTVRFGTDDSNTVDRLIWGLGENAPVGKRVP
ncbi:MAG: serine hydrolase domain-containing protein [Calditrichia bacterium]